MTMETVAQITGEAPLYGDLLELVLSHVPLVDLVPASRVSTSWRRAVASSLHHVNPAKPWLAVHTQGRHRTRSSTTHAYDPRSGLWFDVAEVCQPRADLASLGAVRSSNSTLLYALSPSRFSFSCDPLNLAWRHVEAPLIWRADPVVALVGHRIIVAGGACDFEDDPLSVEAYDLATGAWRACQPMPVILKDSSASTWLSVAADDHRMYVTEKATGVTHWYDPEAQAWDGPHELRPDQSVYFSAIGFMDDQLILVGLTGSAENFKSLKLWRISSDLKESEEITEIPPELAGKLEDEACGVPSIEMCAAGNMVYMHSPARPENVVWCEVGARGEASEWGSVRNAGVSDRSWMERRIYTCARLGVAELQTAVAAWNRRFRVKEESTIS